MSWLSRMRRWSKTSHSVNYQPALVLNAEMILIPQPSHITVATWISLTQKRLRGQIASDPPIHCFTAYFWTLKIEKQGFQGTWLHYCLNGATLIFWMKIHCAHTCLWETCSLHYGGRFQVVKNCILLSDYCCLLTKPVFTLWICFMEVCSHYFNWCGCACSAVQMTIREKNLFWI